MLLRRLRAPPRARHAFYSTLHSPTTSRPCPPSKNHEPKRPSRWSSSPPLATSSSASAAPSTTPPPPPRRRLLVSTPERPLVLAFNLSPHELDALRSAGLGWQVVSVGGDESEEVNEGSLLDVAAGTVTAVDALLPRSPRQPSLRVRATLLVLPEGCQANDGASEGLASYPAAVDEALTEAGYALCVTGVGVGVGAEKEKGKGKKSEQILSDALERLGRAHASASGIWTPLPRLEQEERVPPEASLAMAAFLDASPWYDDDEKAADDDAESQLDLSGLAVVDGLLSAEEASALLLYLTDGDPSSPPEEAGKWQRGAVVDYDEDGGDEEEQEETSTSSFPSSPSSPSLPPPPSSWGATPQFIDSLLSSPPPQLLALCSRLRALYAEDFREILLCPGNDEMSPGLTPLVLNAVTPEDAPSLAPHVDADPLRSDPDGAWARAFGLYRNRVGGKKRSQTKPLLATALLYLQDWPLEDAAETLFFDAEETGLGLAVRPQAGRVVVSEQDVVHRIVPPRNRKRGKSSSSPPRYSLVLKLAFFPKEVEGEGEGGHRSSRSPPTSVVLPAWRRGALRLGTSGPGGWPLPLG